jgi:hypothetical protein
MRGTCQSCTEIMAKHEKMGDYCCFECVLKQSLPEARVVEDQNQIKHVDFSNARAI